MLYNRAEIHRKIYIVLLISLAIALPFSEFLMSSAQIFLAANFLIEGNYKEKIRILQKRKSILVFISIIIVHFIWLIFSEDKSYGLNDIRIKLPLLVLPIIIGCSRPLSFKELKLIIFFFILSVFSAAIYSFFVYFGFTKHQVNDYRDVSIFISHIRFSLMVVLSIFLLFNYIYLFKSKQKLIPYFGILFFIFYLIFLHSYTGIIIFSITLLLMIIKFIFQSRLLKIRFMFSFVLIVIITLTVIFVNKSIETFYQKDEIDKSKFPEFTQNGNKYNHNLKPKITENGHYVFIYISYKELEKEWNKISKIKFDSLDFKGNNIKYTIIRYMTSLNLTKDSAGIAKLTKYDIEAIESGIPNYLYKNKLSLYALIHKVLWEIEDYNQTKDPNKNSLAQRIEYFKAGVHLFKKNFWFGVGTGDVKKAFNEYYEKTNSKLQKEFRLRAHNQFLTFMLTFGISGFFLLIFLFLYPILYEKYIETSVIFFLLIINFLSFINEDTLETQPGVTFFTFFIVIFVFGYKKLSN